MVPRHRERSAGISPAPLAGTNTGVMQVVGGTGDGSIDS